jgi:hydroxymethylbilane synthase
MKSNLKIGTRGSPMAIAQTKAFIAALQKKHPHLLETGAVEIVPIVTSGDRILDRPLSEAGGKGLFTKEIEEALIAGHIDCAVHSMKDMPTVLPEGLAISCLPPRDDVRDAFFSPKAATLDDLPQGAVVGTASLRRQAIILARRPDLKVVTFRGNANTRLKKLEEGVVDATLLALAGVVRIGMEDRIQSVIDPSIMLPAVAQGAIGIETREKDKATQALLDAVHCRTTALRVTAERAYLAVMDGSCRTPLAALMEVPDPEGRARFDVLNANPDGTGMIRHSYLMVVAHEGDAMRLGAHAGAEMKAAVARAEKKQSV